MRAGAVVATVIMGVASSSSSAQEVSLSATQGLSSHRLLGDPRGPSLRVTWPLDDGFPDGYSPFSEPIALNRLELGVSLRKPRSPTAVKARR